MLEVKTKGLQKFISFHSYFLTFLSIIFILTLTSCEYKNPNNSMPKAEETVEVEDVEVIDVAKLKGQKVYVPVYSSIHSWQKDRYVDLTAVLSFHNISMMDKIVISKVDYYDTNGKHLRNYLPKPIALNALATKEFVIQEEDIAGGTGANFVVEWYSDKNIAIPIIESVMVSTKHNQGISFISRGKEIEHH